MHLHTALCWSELACICLVQRRIWFVLMSCPCVFLLEVMLQNEFLFYPDRKYMFMVEKKSLTEYSYSVKDGKSKSFPRCHLDSRVHSHALCKILTYLRQLTYAFTSQSTRILKSFDCALSGPFGNLHLDPALSFPDSLCAHNYFDLRFIGLKRYSIC